jgi:hypothetical protein
MMSYCGPQWISTYTYLALYDGAFAPRLATAGVRQLDLPVPAATGSYIVVAGRINDHQLKKLAPFYRFDLPAGGHDEPGAGHYRIELQSANGQVLFTRLFEIEDHSHEGETAAHAEDIGAFREILPFAPGIARIVIRHDVTILGQRNVSSNSPYVTLLAPNGGESWRTGQQTIRWAGSDADSNQLSYTVQFSADGGQTWSALASNLHTTTYAVDAAALAGSTQARIRVIATDGVNTGLDMSDAVFTTARKAPEVYIISLEDDANVAPGTLVELAGLATDREDGPIDDSRLVWSSDRQGSLGTGPSNAAAGLLPGWHTITLAVTDSDGMTSSANVRIYVGYRVDLPLIRR